MRERAKVLIAIANHGEKNDGFCTHLIETYRTMDYDVSFVVLSDRPKDYGDDVEVVIGAPTKDPWSLPFAHRKVFIDRQDEFDLFIYTEDDTEILDHHLELFLEAERVLPDDKVLGFLRYENDDVGNISYSTVHHVYHWEYDSIINAGGRTYARYTNDHAGAYVLTRDQLKLCIRSGGYRTEPHRTYYDLLVSAATDPYTMCGLEKVVCISDLLHFSLHHLPNVYLDRIGVSQEEFEAQVELLLSATDGSTKLFDPRTYLRGMDTPWDKRYYEPLNQELLSAVSSSARRVLSIGCDRGLNERHLAERGLEVVVVPIDRVIASAAKLQGVTVMQPSLDGALSELAGQEFDTIIFNCSLSYFPDPKSVVRKAAAILTADGSMIAAFDNMADGGRWRRGWRELARVRASGFAGTGIHWTTEGTVTKWLQEGGFPLADATRTFSGRRASLAQKAPSFAQQFLSRSTVIAGTRR